MTNSLVSVTSAAAFLAAVLSATPAVAQQTTQAEPAAGTSATSATATDVSKSETVSPGVRIVRLSQAVGDVKLDRMTGHGFENVFANFPIVQGAKLRTGDGVAEVEFEDSSSLRLTPNSEVEFPVLSMNGSGVRTSTVHVVQGTVYASMTKSKDKNVSLTFGKETLALSPGSHIELALNEKQPRLDVMDGTVEAMNGATTTEVGKKKGLVFDPTGANAPTLVSKNEKGPYAEWDKNAVEYHSRMAPSGNSYAGTPYTYGLADMNYYGSFVPMGGCGMMWQPYMVSANWSPFSNGMWAWYQGAGYSWVSPYPWGWTAFHSGMWNYCPGSGWGWQPTGTWNGLRNSPATLVKQPGRLNMKPPIARPRPVGPTMVPVNTKPLVFSKLNQDTFTFRKDSAGLGVPRGTFGKLNHISADVVHHGSVERQVFMPSAPGRGPEGRGMPGNAGSVAANQGGRNAHTMPATGMGSGAMHTSPAAGSMGGGHSTMSSGSMGGGSMGGGHMSSGSMGGGGMSGGGGHASAGGHH